MCRFLSCFILHLQCLEDKSQNGGEMILLYIEKQAVLQTLLMYFAKDLDPDDSDALNLVRMFPAGMMVFIGPIFLNLGKQ